MGQRLNIEIKKGDKALANAYYHWSAYSSSSCEMALGIVDYIETNQQDCDDVLYAIKILESTGAGLTDFNPTEQEIETAQKYYNQEYYLKWRNQPSELKTAKLMFPDFKFQDCNGRNNGLLSITEYGMSETRKWEEGRVTVDIESKTVCFDVYWDASDFEEKKPIEDLNLDLANLSFDDVSTLKDIIDKYINDGYSKYYKLKNGDIIGFVE